MNKDNSDTSIMVPNESLEKESFIDKTERICDATSNFMDSAARVVGNISYVAETIREAKRADADVRIAQEQAKVIVHKIDKDFEKDINLMDRFFDQRDKVIDADIEAMRAGIESGNMELALNAMASAGNALSTSVADELNKLKSKQTKVEDDPLLDW